MVFEVQVEAIGVTMWWRQHEIGQAGDVAFEVPTRRRCHGSGVCVVVIDLGSRQLRRRGHGASHCQRVTNYRHCC